MFLKDLQVFCYLMLNDSTATSYPHLDLQALEPYQTATQRHRGS